MYSSLKNRKKKRASEGKGVEEGWVAHRNTQLKAEEDRHGTLILLNTVEVITHSGLVLSYQSFGRRSKTSPWDMPSVCYMVSEEMDWRAAI